MVGWISRSDESDLPDLGIADGARSTARVHIWVLGIGLFSVLICFLLYVLVPFILGLFFIGLEENIGFRGGIRMGFLFIYFYF